MLEGKWVFLERDCEALMVPSAVPFSIPGGTEVQIVQALGGHLTVNVRGNLARIDKSDADALGVDIEANTVTKQQPQGPISEVAEDVIWAQLKTVYDPEIPVNIVALGLIYKVKVKPQFDGEENIIANEAQIEMTLTAPGCGMGPVIIADVEAKAREIPSITDVKVELVFDPPWDREMMSEEARLELGLF
jgi:probable FeS assembly SUF system protein SufT